MYVQQRTLRRDLRWIRYLKINNNKKTKNIKDARR